MKRELIQNILGGATGIIDTPAPKLKLYRLDEDMHRQPYLYNPSIIVMCQGTKRVYIKDRTITFDNNNYLIVTGSIPLECEYHASRGSPVMGVIVEIDALLLRTVNAAIEKTSTVPNGAEGSLHIVNPTPLTNEIEEILERILLHLQSDDKTKLFIDDAIKELYYHFLKGDQAPTLQAMLRGGKFAHILNALDYIRRNFEKPITVEDLAGMSHMSPTNFYRSFKEQTGDTPLQLIKKTRLSYAKSMLEQREGPVKYIANFVGYQNPSHFSRDFDRLYGYKPSKLLE